MLDTNAKGQFNEENVATRTEIHKIRRQGQNVTPPVPTDLEDTIAYPCPQPGVNWKGKTFKNANGCFFNSGWNK